MLTLRMEQLLELESETQMLKEVQLLELELVLLMLTMVLPQERE